MIGEKISASILNDWLPKETNVQKLARVRKSIDWLYQDPEHIPKTRENHTIPSMLTISTHSPVKLQRLPQQAPSKEMIHVLHSLNMSALHEQSQQFKYSAIGDVGTILWGTLGNTKTIDFKSKLAENANSTAVNETNTNTMKPTILKRMPKLNVSKPKIEETEQTMQLECKGEKNNTLVIATTETILSATENLEVSSELVQTETIKETTTDKTDSLDEEITTTSEKI